MEPGVVTGPEASTDQRLHRFLWINQAVGLGLCVVMPAVYFGVLRMAKPQVRIQQFLPGGLPKVPWSEPMVMVLAAMAFFTLAGVALFGRVAPRLAAASRKPMDAVAKMLVFTLLGASFLETVAIYGLVLAFAMDERILPLSGMMLLLTSLGYFLLWPTQARWRGQLLAGRHG